MGYDISNEARGVFYLRTSGYWPYYLGEDGLKPPQANLWTNIVNWFKSLY